MSLARGFTNMRESISTAGQKLSRVAATRDDINSLQDRQEPNMAEHSQQDAVADVAKDSLAGYSYTAGKELKTAGGEYFITAGSGSSRVGFLPSSGSLDGAIQFESTEQLDAHLAGVSEQDRNAVKTFVRRSQEQAIGPVENAIARATRVGLHNELEDRFSKVDWYYGYSDDSKVRMAGAAQVQEALKDLETLAGTDREAAKALWSQYGPKTISAPEFLRDPGSEVSTGVTPVVSGEATPEQAAEDKDRATPEEEVENSISAAPGRAPRSQAPVQEDAFMRAPRLQASPANPILADQPKTVPPVEKEGPSTLLNGRFVRRDNGEYFRVADGEESKRVALVDENEKIRFVDKQMDAFQAAIELAKHKEWEAILVIGTEKFRAEAWYHARMADLEVVGYEPTEKDLATLGAAQNAGRAQAVTPGTAVSVRAVSESKAAAVDHALEAGSVVLATNEANGRYAGKVTHQTEHHIVQDVGKKGAVIHDKARFDAADLKKGIDRGDSLRIRYDEGRAAIDSAQERQRSQGVSR
jgi:Large polyvalent protein-associated domain 7